MAAAAAATMVTPPAMMQGGAAAAGQLAFSQSSYLGLQLPTNSSPLHFTSFNSKSNRNVQLRCQAAAPSSRTTLPQLNVDITGVWVLLLSTNLQRAMPLQRFCMPLWISLCPSLLVCTFSFRVFRLLLRRLLRGVCTCHFSCSEVHKNWEMCTKTMSSGVWWWVMEMGTKKLWAWGSADGKWRWRWLDEENYELWDQMMGIGNGDCSGPKKEVRIVERTTVRLALPSKGRMAEDTLALLKV